MVIEIAEHSLDVHLLTPASQVLDAGCRCLAFSTDMLKYVDAVTALDADPDVQSNHPRIKVYNVALGSGLKGPAALVKFGNGTGNYLCQAGDNPLNLPAGNYSLEYPPLFTLPAFNKYVGVAGWDVIKLDIEGAEYDVLNELSYPPARQITVEFHQHTAARRTEAELSELIKKMQTWYTVTGFNLTDRHGAGLNYWDVLMVLKK